jgi:hypothetical protein
VTTRALPTTADVTHVLIGQTRCSFSPSGRHANRGTEIVDDFSGRIQPDLV